MGNLVPIRSLPCFLQVHEEPFAERQSTLPSSLPPSETMGNLVPIRETRSFQSERSMQRARHMQETWLLLEYCDKGSLQVSDSAATFVGIGQGAMNCPL